MAKKMKNDNPRGSTELRGTLARAVRLLEYLRKNTDKDHPISQTALLRAGGDDHIFGAKKTLAKNLVVLANALNTDEYNGLKPEEDWRLSFRGFDDHYANGNCDSDDDSDDAMISDVTGIYFNHIFSEDELTAIINALNTSKAVSKAKAKVIIEKVLKNLAREEYKKNYEKQAYELDFSEPTDSLPGADEAQLAENIAFIQKAISGRLRIKYVYNSIYSSQKGELKPNGNIVRSVSPHYIVCDNGRLFMYGGYDNGTPCVHRVDLMTELGISGKGNSTIRSLDKNSIGLEERNEAFRALHLSASYKKDWITITFKWSCRDEKTDKFICTALYGAFGNAFKIDENGLVTVRASRFGMKIFALQYADYVKVESPSDLVEDIAGSVRGLRDKYL
ncbi:MAG: WYL domain-containing protein [Ruminococcaceae bacterium]|nr:WYL domain-containing protein [Oscillospiraceae bacterium]